MSSFGKICNQKQILERKMRMDKRGVLGDGILLIYRIVLVTIIAVVIMAISAVFYDYNINVRNEEARIITKGVVNCLSPEGVVFFGGIPERDFLSDYCGLVDVDGRIFVRVSFLDLGDDGVVVKEIIHGDSGSEWVRKFNLAENLEKYKYGYSSLGYPVVLVDGLSKQEVLMRVEVTVSHED